MNILVTGCQGYLGSVLCQKLIDNKHNITGIDNLRYWQSKPDFKFYKEDVRLDNWLNLVEDNDIIIHLAALVGPICDKFSDEAWQVNFDSVVNLVNRFPNKKIILPVTNSFMGSQTATCDENSDCNPLSLYAETKYNAEQYLQQHNNWISLRLATVYGVGKIRTRLDLLVNDFTRQLYQNKKIEIYEGHFKRNYISIEDVTDCFLFCINNWATLKNEIYCVGNDDENMSKFELATLIQKHTQGTVISGTGEDKDKRNYTISSQKIYSKGFKCKDSIENQIIKLKNWLDNHSTITDLIINSNHINQKYWTTLDHLGYPGYKISTDGELMGCRKPGSDKIYPWKEIKGYINRDGRQRVQLVNNKITKKYIHKVTLEAFIGKHNLHCCHNNGDYKNNYIYNLRYDTQAGNIQDKIFHNTIANGSKNGSSELSNADIKEIRKLYKPYKYTQRQLAKEFSVSEVTIWNILKHKTWSHI